MTSSDPEPIPETAAPEAAATSAPTTAAGRPLAAEALPGPDSDPLWYRNSVFYELHVRAFCDSDGDGIGDFRGLTGRLDYLQDLGVDTLWLLPFYPSPQKDDGYDIANYTGIHPDYGTPQDFRRFLAEAHGRNLRVITELVLNHTSDQHPWFQRARRAPAGSPERNFYVWSDTPEKYRGTRIIFKDFEPSNWSWDPVAKAYYWHRFYAHQPDLNFDNGEVRRSMLRVVDHWLGLGVDGLRLDAVPYLYEREGTSCENLPETHAFLKVLRAHVDRHYAGRMLLAEANQWPEDATAYFGQGDECNMAFHFPLMPRLFMAIRMEDRFPIIDILQQTPAIPENCQWALFLRNHDELTLEMVTDEDRDYMYRVYAGDPRARINLGIRRRLAPLLGNQRRTVELMNGLLFSLPGTPILYYGDEIGMGDNIYLGDRNGVRTPMQWSADRNAGFSRANPQRLYLPVTIDPEYHYEAVNVEAQQANVHSLLWWTKRLIALRRRHQAFGRGSIEFLLPDNRKILAFVRRYGEEAVLVLANLSRFTQYAHLDLRAYRDSVPVELFGRNAFPVIGDSPYFFTLGPHSFYWFSLQKPRAEASTRPPELPAATVAGSWVEALRGRRGAPVEEFLPEFLKRARWFGGRTRTITAARILDVVAGPAGAPDTVMALCGVEYTEGEPDTYLLPLGFAHGPRAEEIREKHPDAQICRVQIRHGGRGPAEGILHDPTVDPAFASAWLALIAQRRTLRGSAGEITAVSYPALRRIWPAQEPAPEPVPLSCEQTNSSVAFGRKLILKFYRRLDRGINPDLEISRFLSEQTAFNKVPPLAGSLEYRPRRGEPYTVGLLQGFVPNEGDAWHYTLDSVERYFERVLALDTEKRKPPLQAGTASILDETAEEPDPSVRELIGTYLDSATLLGQRTAELHLALASVPDDPAFAPEEIPPHYRNSLFQSVRNQGRAAFQALRQQLGTLPSALAEEARRLLDLEPAVNGILRRCLEENLTARCIRVHGDFHLGQVLYVGNDFIIFDFEGEPARPISERRIKRPALRDVAGMLRSFDYAATFARTTSGRFRPEDQTLLEPFSRLWIHWVSVLFLKSYLRTAEPGGFLPRSATELRGLLRFYLIEKTFYELRYELDHRPAWAGLPLQGLLELLEQPAPQPAAART